MNSFLLNRQLGTISPQALAQGQNFRLVSALQPADSITFASQTPDDRKRPRTQLQTRDLAHASGVNSIAIDRFEGRYLISAGADSSVAIWDLEATTSTSGLLIHLPLAISARTSTKASLSVTHVSFYPFDSLALLTTGYDHTLKLFSSETLQLSASFDLGSTVYSHATSNVATHLLVACASQHPAVRLVDLRSGSATHSLAGHAGSVLSVAWHPTNENILASGATDGVVRLWDVRRSASSLGVLDMEDSIGLVGHDSEGTGARSRERGRAHNGAVNGVVWTSNGKCLVSNGHDERMRVWDTNTGSNVLLNFGPGLKNATTTTLLPLIAPTHLSPEGQEMIYYPNPKDILAFELHSGTSKNRLRVKDLPGQQSEASMGNSKTRTTSLAWRPHHVEMYSAHGDGTVRCWKPRTAEDLLVEQDELEDLEEDATSIERKRKREEFDEIVRELTSKKITFS